MAAACMRASCESVNNSGFHSSNAIIRPSVMRRRETPTKSFTRKRPSCACIERAMPASASRVARSPSPISAAANISTARMRAAVRSGARCGSKMLNIGNSLALAALLELALGRSLLPRSRASASDTGTPMGNPNTGRRVASRSVASGAALAVSHSRAPAHCSLPGYGIASIASTPADSCAGSSAPRPMATIWSRKSGHTACSGETATGIMARNTAT